MAATDGYVEQGMASIGERLTPLEQLRPDCPAPLRELVARATARTAEDRLPDIAAFRALLDTAYPRQTDDVGHWRTWLQDLYRRDTFVTR
jgi:hypothetical protein